MHIYRQPTMHDHARVDLFTLTANLTMHISVVMNQSWPMTDNMFLFSLLDLKTSSSAPEQELTLHTTFEKLPNV